MSDTITTDSATRRMRNGSVILINRHCEKRVERRVKIYDRKCPGLYVSVIPSGVATFNFKFTDRTTGKQRTKWLGVYNPDFAVDNARTAVYALKNRIGNGENVAETLRQNKAQRARQGKTVDEIIEERIEWMKTPVLKSDGEQRPRIESWENVARHLRNFLSPPLGKKLAAEITKHDIATLSNDIVAGKHGGKASVSNARHMRRAASGLFNWACEAGRDYVTASPCVNLPKLDDEHPRDRVLTEDEIRTLWHGLDREDMPWDRKTRLAIKFALATMLRSGEMLPIHRDELNTASGTVDIPARRVKKRRVINQPLSDLALEIITDAMGNYEYAFAGRFGDAPLSRQAMSGALAGTKVTKDGGDDVR
jgi:integrase